MLYLFQFDNENKSYKFFQQNRQLYVWFFAYFKNFPWSAGFTKQKIQKLVSLPFSQTAFLRLILYNYMKIRRKRIKIEISIIKKNNN